MDSSFLINRQNYLLMPNNLRGLCSFDFSVGRASYQTVRYKFAGQSLHVSWELNRIDDISSNSHQGHYSFDSSTRWKMPHKVRFKVLAQSFGDKWNLKGFDVNAVQGSVNSWLLRTRNFLNEVTYPLVKDAQIRKSDSENVLNAPDLVELFISEQTIDSRTSNGNLSFAAIVSIEQFSRLNGSTGKNSQKIFESLIPESDSNIARSLVEYCCFRFLSRDTSDLHPCLKEPAFQKLIFITMLAWENPYSEENVSFMDASKNIYFQDNLVRENAFVRIAPAIAGMADHSNVHNLFRAVAGEDKGISLSLWSKFIDELLKVHGGIKVFQNQDSEQISERVLCTVSNGKQQPVLKWENNIAWPGKLTLTDKALYFEAIGMMGQKSDIRLNLTNHGSRVNKTRVGPFGSDISDNAVTVSSGIDSERWVLEFVDLKGEMRRDVWHAFISEVIAVYMFIREYGPDADDQSLSCVYGAEKGNERAMTNAINSIARLQALKFMRKLMDPIKLLPFSYLKNAPFGDVVCQTLALNYWGGHLLKGFNEAQNQLGQDTKPSEVENEMINNVVDIDGSVYLRNWKKSQSWFSTDSIMFWKSSSSGQGIVLSKKLVVADLNLIERAALTSKNKSLVAENTQATIDAAMLKGIPSNIDLFKELLLPLTVAAKNFEKLRHWEEPLLTVSFLTFSYAVIFRNLLSYVFPVSLLILSVVMLLVKGLKEQGRLGRSFGKVTIHDQPPSNTIQKIIAIKGAIDDVETFLQRLNVVLLKIRTLLISGHPQITSDIAVMLFIFGTVLLIVPFKYVIAFLLLDLFTRELRFRKEMTKKFMRLMKERWDMVPAAPVIILPFKNKNTNPQKQQPEDAPKTKQTQ